MEPTLGEMEQFPPPDKNLFMDKFGKGPENDIGQPGHDTDERGN
jgi:hypothetical protein